MSTHLLMSMHRRKGEQNKYVKSINDYREERRDAIEQSMDALKKAGADNSVIRHRYGLFKAGKMMPPEERGLLETMQKMLDTAQAQEEAVKKAVLVHKNPQPEPEPEPVVKASASFRNGIEIVKRASALEAAGYRLPKYATEQTNANNPVFRDGIVQTETLASWTSEQSKEELCKSILAGEVAVAQGMPFIPPIKSNSDLIERVFVLKKAGIDVPLYSDALNHRIAGRTASEEEVDALQRCVVALETAQALRKSGKAVPADILDGIEPTVQAPANPSEAQKRGHALLSKGIALPSFRAFETALTSGSMTGALFESVSEEIIKAERSAAVTSMRKSIGLDTAPQETPQNPVPESWNEVCNRADALQKAITQKSLSPKHVFPEFVTAAKEYDRGILTPERLERVGQKLVRLETEFGIKPPAPKLAPERLVKAQEPISEPTWKPPIPWTQLWSRSETLLRKGVKVPGLFSLGDAYNDGDYDQSDYEAVCKSLETLEGEHGIDVPIKRNTSPADTLRKAVALPQNRRDIALQHGETVSDASRKEVPNSEPIKFKFEPKTVGSENVQVYRMSPDEGVHGTGSHEKCTCTLVPGSQHVATYMTVHPNACRHCVEGVRRFNAEAEAEFNKQRGIGSDANLEGTEAGEE